MITQERDDMVWKAFVETALDVAPGLQGEFLRKLYEIQKKYQFSEDNSESLQLMERLIDEQVKGAE